MTDGKAVGRTCLTTIRAELGAEGARRLHVLQLARAQRLPAHEARVAHPADHAEREDDVRQARPEDRDERDRQQDAGKRHQDVDRAADHIVHGAAEVAGDRAERHADERRHRHDGQADEERDARPRHETRQDVAPELVETERDATRLGGSRRCASVCAEGSYGVSDGPERRGQHGDQHDGEPDFHHSKRIRGSRNP